MSVDVAHALLFAIRNLIFGTEPTVYWYEIKNPQRPCTHDKTMAASSYPDTTLQNRSKENRFRYYAPQTCDKENQPHKRENPESLADLRDPSALYVLGIVHHFSKNEPISIRFPSGSAT